mgnify:CR=1 FL=1
MVDFLKEYIQNIGIELNQDKINKLINYYELLIEKNKVMNLTAITEYKDVVIKHFADSLSIIKAVNMSEITNIIDIGTGAGFPGMVLKIVFPDVKITLLDSLNKRVKFLNQVIEELGLTGIETVHSRAEDGGRNKDLREHFDVSVSRAVANLATLVEYNLPFIKVGGYFVAYKSGDIDEELVNAKKAVSVLGGTIEEVKKFQLPGTDIDRSLVYIKKIKPTSGKFPRKAGLPSKEPIS